MPPPPVPVARAFLASTRLLRELDEAALDEVAGYLEWLILPGGQTLCRQGEEADALYFVVSGRLAVLRRVAGGEDVLLGELSRGDTVGEVALVTGRPQNATVRALRDVAIARLSRAHAGRLLEKHPRSLLAIIRTIAGWLEPSPAPARRGGSLALAVVPAGEVPLAGFISGLVRSLSALGDTLHVARSHVDRHLGADASLCADGSVLHERLVEWIDEQEARCSFLVYEADAAAGAWTRRCLRQADRILVVADGATEPSLGPLGPELSRLEQDQGRQIEELVLLHGDAEGHRPRGTAAWLALRPFYRHHHVRRRGADFDRLARFIDGSAVGLVLGGGGARGFAHIGVIRALEEAGIAIDRVGGTSMGGVIGGLYAGGHDWQDMLALNRWGWVELRPHKVYTLPLFSLLSPARGDRMLERMFGAAQIEDLWTDFFCVSTNLTRTEVVVHRQGDLRRAVKASTTLPGITPPMLGREGDLLVDGGVLNNLPTDVMRRLGDGPIIAVDVSAKHDLRADPSYSDPPDPWSFLAGWWRGAARRRPFPNIVRLIHRSALLASDVYAKQAKNEVELYLDLPMDGFDLFAMESLDRIVEFGYEFARKTLSETPWDPRGRRPATLWTESRH